MKKGEKVDYAIMHANEVQMLIECKKANGELKVEHASQLYRYFSVTNARITVLTNGVEYCFYTDLDSPNRMDSKPFMVLDLNDVDESLLPELRKLTKASIDLGSVVDAEEDLERGRGIETILEELEGCQVVKAIACSEVKPQRISQRDSKSSFAVLLDHGGWGRWRGGLCSLRSTVAGAGRHRRGNPCCSVCRCFC